MLSYQHQYHAGNFADVHKHLALISCLQYMQQKPKGFTVIDTHAGDGEYLLTDPAAEKTAEAAEGCLALQKTLSSATNSPDLIQKYSELLSNYSSNDSDNWQTYPGSPAIAGELAREQDNWIGFEAHPQAHSNLQKLCKHDPQMSCHRRDSFEGLQALLPIASGRGLVIVDPSYEVKQDYNAIPPWLAKAFTKMPQMTIIIWYPILRENRHQRMISALESLDISSYASSEWRNAKSYQGMSGSGVAILNPPWNMKQSFADSMDWLCQQQPFADFSHQWKQSQS